MTTQSDSPKTFEAGEDMDAFLRVVISNDGTVMLADAVDYGIGVTQKDSDDGESVAVRLDSHGGSSKMTASGAIIAGRKVYAAASGKIAATGTNVIGTAIDAASGNGSVIEVLPHVSCQQSSSSSSSSSSS